MRTGQAVKVSTVQYGQCRLTAKFQQAGCSSDIQSANKIGFWCDWDGGDGSVMMIGGRPRVSTADHGIGITETDQATVIDKAVHMKLNMIYHMMLKQQAAHPSPTR